jgi:hypothetical protein
MNGVRTKGDGNPKTSAYQILDKMEYVIPILWITKDITSRGPQVADMECREAT